MIFNYNFWLKSKSHNNNDNITIKKSAGHLYNAKEDIKLN